MGGDELGSSLLFLGGGGALESDLIGLRHGIAGLNAGGQELGHVEGEAVIQ